MQAASALPGVVSTGTNALRISPSSYDLWKRCNRWWAFQYIEGLRAPPGDKANLGSRCHTIAERYLKYAEAPDHSERVELEHAGSVRSFYPGRIVSNVLHHLPPAGSVVRCEERLDFRYKGIEFAGIIDWQTDTHIGDHKFTGDLAYAKSANDLLTDPQAVIYRTSRWLESDARELILQWTYGEFTAKASKVVRLPVLREFESINSFLPTIDAMQHARSTVTEANSVEPTGLRLRPKIACEMYGGCPHLDRCHRSGKQVHKNKIEAHMQSTVLERLRARANGAQGAQPEQTATNAHSSGPQPNAAVQAVQRAQVAVQNAGQINPPGEAHEPLPPAETVDTGPQTAAVPSSTEPVRRPRGRPRKHPLPPTTPTAPAPATTATTGAPIGGVVSTTATAPSTTAPNTATDTATERTYHIGTLYVNCRPIRSVNNTFDATDTYDLIRAAHKLVQEDQAVAHYKFIEYGKGAGALCIALRMVVEERGYIPAVCLSTRSAESLDLMQVFAELSESIVVGV